MRLITLICALACAAAAQVVDGVNVSISRIVTVPADQAEFTALVTVTLDTTQQQVVQIFQDAGVANPVVVGVAAGANPYPYPYPTEPVSSQFLYQVSFTTPPGAVKDLAKKLDTLRGAPPEGVTSFQYAASLTAGSAAVESVRRTLLPQLIAEARIKAQTLAEAAGIRLGAVVGVSESSYAYGTPVGGYLLSSVLSSSISTGASGTQYTFYAMVKFATQ
jgi:uncharacterized protein YggE